MRRGAARARSCARDELAGEGERAAYGVGRGPAGDRAGPQRGVDRDDVPGVVLEEGREATQLDETERVERLTLGLAEPHDPPDHPVRPAKGQAFAHEVVGQ